MNQHTGPSVTEILRKVESGESGATAELFSLVYDELRRLARIHLRQERRNHTLQPTALVHEAFLRLLGGQSLEWKDRAHFLAVAARAMRWILVDHVRKNMAAKRGGAARHRKPTEAPDPKSDKSEYVLALDEALNTLAEIDERQAKVVELRFFGGLTIEEVAAALDVGHATVERDWKMAKAWLHHRISGGSEGEE